jgi:predicted alpha/beta superfamily hydrolase
MRLKSMFWALLVFVIVYVLSSGAIIAQDKDQDIVAGKTVKIFSKILNEERQVYISIPYDYDKSIKRYPVLYSTDGDEEMVLKAGGLIHHLEPDQIPEMIAVFIPNTDRGRDLSVTPLEQLPNSGGAEKFLKFITEELIPFIDENYRSTDYRMLVGYSAGAEFAYYALLSKPEYFNAYVAASLCVFDENYMLDKTLKFFKSQKTLNKFLYIPYYEEDYKIATLNIPKIKKIIEENIPKGFQIIIKTYKGRAHVLYSSLNDGLLAIFHDWKRVRTPEITPSNGRLSNDKSIEVELKGYDASIRYTLDGTEPTRESILYTNPIIISQPATLKAKSFRDNLGESNVTTAEFKNEPIFSAEKKIADLKPGINYNYYETRWFRLLDSISLDPTKQGVTDKFNISLRTRDQGFLIQFEGFINIKEEGLYRFYLLSTTGCKLFLGNSMIINNPCTKAKNDPLYVKEEYSYEAYLDPGYYPIKVLYTNPWFYGDDFVVSYKGPGFEKKEIPAEVLFYKNN